MTSTIPSGCQQPRPARGEMGLRLQLASVVSWEKKGMVMLKVKVCFVAFVLTAHVFGEVTGSTENAYACDR